MTDPAQLVDVRQTQEYARYMHATGWKVLADDNKPPFIYVKKLLFTPFHTLKVLRHGVHIPEKKYQKLLKKHKAFVSKQEIHQVEKITQGKVYFKIDPENTWPLTPTKTLWLDLKVSSQELIERMKPKTRYNIRKAQRSELASEVVVGDKISAEKLNEFYSLWSKNKPHNWLFRPKFSDLKDLVASFGDKCFFVFVRSRDSGIILAANLILTSTNMAFYWHNGSTPEGKSKLAPTLALWLAVLECKRRWLHIFDFEGVWDERYPKLNSGWKGFTKFKEGFTSTPATSPSV
jgi:lipid II:glycine glycyltransferase (peptidoglycan interpeptide bridge formation enzyme)